MGSGSRSGSGWTREERNVLFKNLKNCGVSQVAVRLSVKEKETKDAVQRLLDEVYNLKGELAAEKQKHFEQIAASCVGKENVLLIEGDMEPVEVRKCTDAILDTCSGVAAFFAGNDKDGYKYAIGQREGDVRELVKQVNKELNGRGNSNVYRNIPVYILCLKERGRSCRDRCRSSDKSAGGVR